jgi:hypothetical protein
MIIPGLHHPQGHVAQFLRTRAGADVNGELLHQAFTEAPGPTPESLDSDIHRMSLGNQGLYGC